jgi:hypothetical protein
LSTGGRTCSATYPPSGGIVNQDGPRRMASTSARRTPRSLTRHHPKEDAAHSPPPPPVKKKWWEMEAQAQAAFRGGRDITSSSAGLSRKTNDRSRSTGASQRCGPPWTMARTS